MTNGFSFDRALTYPFKAPHFNSFPWMFAGAYAAIYVVLFLIVGLLSWQSIAEWFLMMQQLENTTSASPEEIFGMMFGAMGKLMPVFIAGGIASWVVWAVFETASQRRYLYGEKFSLGFGGDEVRMMAVGLLWGLMSLVIFAVPGFIMLGAFTSMIEADFNGPMSDDEIVGMLGPFFAGFGLMLLLSFVYIFVATRFAPCFGLTVKEKEIRFFDAWKVSHGRFWPLLGSYAIIAIVVSILSQIVSTVAQFAMMPFMMSLPQGGSIPAEELRAVFFSPGFIIPMALIYFVLLFVQGLTQHFAGAPAALAARHDPRNDLGEAQRVDIFS